MQKDEEEAEALSDLSNDEEQQKATPQAARKKDPILGKTVTSVDNSKKASRMSEQAKRKMSAGNTSSSGFRVLSDGTLERK